MSEQQKMVKVKIHGYSRQEGSREFEILSREELEDKIYNAEELAIYQTD